MRQCAGNHAAETCMLSFEIYKYRLRALYSSRTISIKALNGQAAPSGGPCEVRGAAAGEAPEDDFASVRLPSALRFPVLTCICGEISRAEQHMLS